MKKIVALMTAFVMSVGILTGCGSSAGEAQEISQGAETNVTETQTVESKQSQTAGEDVNPAQQTNAASSFDATQMITIVSREDGSGTRGAFIELFGVEEKAEDGSKKDRTSIEANIVNKTDVMLTTIAGDPYGIGYVSLGSLNDTIKPVQIDGVDATAENVKNGSYAISRPFNIATKGEPQGLAKDFIDFIMSKEGQEVVAKSYIVVSETAATYAGTKPEGKIIVAGSSSVTPVMEKLKEAYVLINPNATIEIQMSDSTAGMTGTIDGICDIGMASRALKDNEASELKSMAIALDGIAVIVHPENPTQTLSKEQVKSIFVGEAETWSDVK